MPLRRKIPPARAKWRSSNIKKASVTPRSPLILPPSQYSRDTDALQTAYFRLFPACTFAILCGPPDDGALRQARQPAAKSALQSKPAAHGCVFEKNTVPGHWHLDGFLHDFPRPIWGPNFDPGDSRGQWARIGLIHYSNRLPTPGTNHFHIPGGVWHDILIGGQM